MRLRQWLRIEQCEPLRRSASNGEGTRELALTDVANSDLMPQTEQKNT
jgi:hypothetical protein